MSARKDIFKDNMRAGFVNTLSSKHMRVFIKSVCEALSLAGKERMAWKRNACVSLPLSVSLLNTCNRSGYLPIYVSLYTNRVAAAASSRFGCPISAKKAQFKVFIYANSTKCPSNAARMAQMLKSNDFENVCLTDVLSSLLKQVAFGKMTPESSYHHTFVCLVPASLYANSCSYALLDFLRAYTNHYSYSLMRGVKISQSDALQKGCVDADSLRALYTSLSGMRIEAILAERKSCIKPLYRTALRCTENAPANTRMDKGGFERIATMILCPQNTPANTRLSEGGFEQSASAITCPQNMPASTRLAQGVRTQFDSLMNCPQNVPANECLLRAKRSSANELQTCTKNAPANTRLHEPRTRFVKSMIACPQNIPSNGCMQTCDCSIQNNAQACTEIGTVHTSASRTVAATANSRRNCVDMRTVKRAAYDAAVALRFTQAHCVTIRTVCIDARDAKRNFLPTQSCCLNNRTVSFTQHNTTWLGEVA